MEWDQIAEKWNQMALRLRSDNPTGGRMPGSSPIDGLPDSLRTQTPGTYASSDGLSRMRSAEKTGNERGLTPGQ